MAFDDGIVRITLDGQEQELRPTLHAAKAISRHFGGYTQALQQVQAMNIESMAAVIRYAVKANDDLQKRLPDLVFNARPLKLMAPLVEFLMILANGGQPLTETDEGNGQAADAA